MGWARVCCALRYLCDGPPGPATALWPRSWSLGGNCKAVASRCRLDRERAVWCRLVHETRALSRPCDHQTGRTGPTNTRCAPICSSRKTIKCAVPPGPGKSGFSIEEPLPTPLPWQKSKCKNNRKSRIPGSFENLMKIWDIGPQKAPTGGGCAERSGGGPASRAAKIVCARSPTLSNAPGFEWARMCGSASSPFYDARTCRSQAGQKKWKLREVPLHSYRAVLAFARSKPCLVLKNYDFTTEPRFCLLRYINMTFPNHFAPTIWV